MATNSIKLLTGNSHPQLAKQVADRLFTHSAGYWAGDGFEG
jgi:phosphoribosylpyrophosphate synthetase